MSDEQERPRFAQLSDDYDPITIAADETDTRVPMPDIGMLGRLNTTLESATPNDLDSAALDNELLMDDLYSPFERTPPRPTERRDVALDTPAQPTLSEVDKARAELRRKIFSELGQNAGDFYPEPPTPARKPNLFARMRRRAQSVVRDRVEKPKAHRYGRRLVIGAALVASVGIGVSMARDGDRPSSFTSVREILSEPGDFVNPAIAAQVSSDYARGAALAEVAVLQETYRAVTDAEARLAIVSKGVEVALRARDTHVLADWMILLEGIPGNETDRRASIIREKAYLRLAQVDRANGRDVEARRWELWARQEAEKAETQKVTIKGKGWNAELASQMETGLRLAKTRLPGGVPAEYRAGFEAAVAEASQMLKVTAEMAGLRQGRTR